MHDTSLRRSQVVTLQIYFPDRPHGSGGIAATAYLSAKRGALRHPDEGEQLGYQNKISG
ncbi:MAG TPA: hypothetical protein VMA37_11365 [Acetobacteraceae bacterium]|nr:hypothetical protein [Acetobacteraceae bacterium]